MKRIILILACVCGATHARAQYTYTDSIQWQTYEDFNKIFLDARKKSTAAPSAASRFMNFSRAGVL